jgi:SpoVK/Ycf46/Vps4 family AAA+-type ATPase
MNSDILDRVAENPRILRNLGITRADVLAAIEKAFLQAYREEPHKLDEVTCLPLQTAAALSGMSRHEITREAHLVSPGPQKRLRITRAELRRLIESRLTPPDA